MGDGAGLAALRKQYTDAVPAYQGSSAEDALAHAEAVLLADSNAIYDYFHNNVNATGVDSRGDTHALTLT